MADGPCVTVTRRVLATDLDGTLIPHSSDQQNLEDLRTLTAQLKRDRVMLVYVTGRHFQSVLQAMGEFHLPTPEWVICDVGTSIFQRHESGEFSLLEAYQQHQEQILTSMPIQVLRRQLESIETLRLQPEGNQGQFKLSFYVQADQLDRLARHVQAQLDRTNAPYSIVASVDPFTGAGLIDLLPSTVSKAHALRWWAEHTKLSEESIVFAGDSGNDWEAFTAGYRTIVVGNADHRLAQRVHAAHQDAGWRNRLCLARGSATSGLLEGCRRFQVIGA